jgi:hypothetical protein
MVGVHDAVLLVLLWIRDVLRADFGGKVERLRGARGVWFILVLFSLAMGELVAIAA